jgi:acetyl-CoA C-acetyltransferase
VLCPFEMMPLSLQPEGPRRHTALERGRAASYRPPLPRSEVAAAEAAVASAVNAAHHAQRRRASRPRIRERARRSHGRGTTTRRRRLRALDGHRSPPCPTTDGAAAAIVCRPELAKGFKKPPVWVKGAALAVETGRPFFDPTFDYLGFRSTVKAAKAAYAMAGCGPEDISFADVHDCFTWTEIANIEDLGFYEKGQGWKAVEAGETALGGKIPINTSGGLKSFGHPIGASGVRMIYECVTQLRGECGERQVQNARFGMAHNVGGPGAVACVVILGNA